MGDRDIRMLVEGIVDYLEWLKSMRRQAPHRSLIQDSLLLLDFLRFAARNDMVWEEMFAPQALKAFSHGSGFKHASRALLAVSSFLSINGRIPRPLSIPRRPIQLPDPFNAYLHQLSHKASSNYLRQVKGFLVSFHDHLEKHNLALAQLKIEDLDQFLAGLKVARSTRSVYRSYLRVFLTYLHRERRVVKKDLAPLLVGPRLFCRKKPP